MILIIILIITVKVATISYEYRYFAFSILIFLIISVIGWLGFTLNFLILLVLYSTLLVIFWIFSISFEDFSLKRELSESLNVYWAAIILVFFFIKSPVYLGTQLVYRQLESALMVSYFSGSREMGEFLIIYLSIFFYHFITLCCFFFSLVVVCKVVVSLLVVRSKASLGGGGLPLTLKKIKTGVLGTSKRVLTWTACFRKVKIKVFSGLNNQF